MADNLSSIIEPICICTITSKRTEINRFFPVPKKRVGPYFVCHRHLANHLTAFVETVQVEHLRAADCPEVVHPAVLPQERMTGWYAGERVRRITRVRKPRHLSGLIHVERKAVRTTQRAQIVHHSVFQEERMHLCSPAIESTGIERIGDRIRG